MKIKWWLLKCTQPTLPRPFIQKGRNLRMMTVTQLQVIFVCIVWYSVCDTFLFILIGNAPPKLCSFQQPQFGRQAFMLIITWILKWKYAFEYYTSGVKVKLKGWMLKQIQPTPFQPLIQRRRNLSMMIVTGLQVILICCVTVCKWCKCDTFLFISTGNTPPEQRSPQPKPG